VDQKGRPTRKAVRTGGTARLQKLTMVSARVSYFSLEQNQFYNTLDTLWKQKLRDALVRVRRAAWLRVRFD
jgi:hypothetical protein